ncbi:hypothetical protein ACQB60_42535 [Actinomycetota bacterium Odt1-20B]
MLLLAWCTLLVGVCHSHGGQGQDAVRVPGVAAAPHGAQHDCPAPGHGEHADPVEYAAGPSLDRQLPESGGAQVNGRAVPESRRLTCAPVRAGPRAAGQQLLIALGVDRN